LKSTQEGLKIKTEDYRKNKNHFLDSGKVSALLGVVSTLGLTLRERVCSRLVFYLLVFSGMWAANRILPDRAEAEAAKWAALGVARPYIAVPIEELEMIVIRESR